MNALGETPVERFERELLLEAIYRRWHYDFRGYAAESMRRRLDHARTALGEETLSAVQARVLRDPVAFARVLEFLTVQVSDLFRDPPFWTAVRAHVLPFLETFPFARLWVAGCGDGEEIYTLAILLGEAGLLDRTMLYATDVSPDALQRAKAGIYPLERIAGFSRNYRAAGGGASLSDYYVASYGAAAFDAALRRNVVFADHSLATDGVFAEVQFVSCRNVLIYFDRSLQDRALALFRDALGHGGFLGLGHRESPRFSAHAAAFHDVDAEHRLYRRAR